jgi:hypothetical protein
MDDKPFGQHLHEEMSKRGAAALAALAIRARHPVD